MTRTLNILPLTLTMDPVDIGQLQALLEGVHKIILLDKVVFELISASPLKFLYKLIAADTRIWKQDIHFDNPTNPLMTFNVVDEWRLSEFSSQRTLRNLLISFISKYPTIESIKYNF